MFVPLNDKSTVRGQKVINLPIFLILYLILIKKYVIIKVEAFCGPMDPKESSNHSGPQLKRSLYRQAAIIYKNFFALSPKIFVF
jgi:hypothetical protein